MIEKTENDLVQFGTLDKIIPYASNWPYSWETFGKGLIQNVKNIGSFFNFIINRQLRNKINH